MNEIVSEMAWYFIASCFGHPAIFFFRQTRGRHAHSILFAFEPLVPNNFASLTTHFSCADSQCVSVHKPIFLAHHRHFENI